MSIYHARIQRPVGQGFFHSAHIEVDGQTSVSYVYDCGSMGKYAKPRNAQIDDYIASRGAGSDLDLLFISHTHADHVNGLPRLLAPKTGLKVDTIVLPLTEPAERAMTFASAISDDPDAAGDEFFRAMTIDPATAISRFSPRQVIYVRRGGPDDQPPNGLEPPLYGPDGPRVSGREIRGYPSWKLAGRGTVSLAATESNIGAQAQVSVEMPDSLAVAAGAGNLTWLLLPYVDPAVGSQQKKFLPLLASGLKIPRKAVHAWLSAPTNMLALVTKNVGLLKEAYAAVAHDLNVTSLCLYSGPALFNARGAARSLDGRHGIISVHAMGHDDVRLGWLATGDADLKQAKRRADFLHHYGALVSQVVTITLPHHGSARNFDAELLDVGANAYVAAADQYRSWPHPGASVVQAVFSAGRVLHVVTSAFASMSFETAELGL